MVVTARNTASASNACRHPSRSIKIVATGRKIVLAKPATKVSRSKARLRKRRNQVATTVKAGSYSVAAMTTPMASQSR